MVKAQLHRRRLQQGARKVAHLGTYKNSARPRHIGSHGFTATSPDSVFSAVKMCYQSVDLYAPCHCLYYRHPVARCRLYGRPGHVIRQRTTIIEYACSYHGPASGEYDDDPAFTMATPSSAYTKPEYCEIKPDFDSGSDSDYDSHFELSRYSKRSTSFTNPSEGVQDPFERLLPDFLSQEPLQHLLPQLVRLSGSAARRQSTSRDF